jgi:hypothetical protein
MSSFKQSLQDMKYESESKNSMLIPVKLSGLIGNTKIASDSPE